LCSHVLFLHAGLCFFVLVLGLYRAFSMLVLCSHSARSVLLMCSHNVPLIFLLCSYPALFILVTFSLLVPFSYRARTHHFHALSGLEHCSFHPRTTLVNYTYLSPTVPPPSSYHSRTVIHPALSVNFLSLHHIRSCSSLARSVFLPCSYRAMFLAPKYN
jgi:hypothetical protein